MILHDIPLDLLNQADYSLLHEVFRSYSVLENNLKMQICLYISPYLHSIFNIAIVRQYNYHR